MTETPYHRTREHDRWRGVGEVLIAIGLVFGGMVALTIAVFAVAGAQELDELDDLSRFVVLMGGLALTIPATRIAARLMDRRPGTLSSVAGHLRWRWLARCVLLALIIDSIPLVLSLVAVLAGADTGLEAPRLDTFVPMAIVMLVIVPLQAAGEEYFFRGTLLQAVGGWTKSPWLPVGFTAVAFCAIHFAPLEASVALLAMGLIDGYLTVRTGGLEAAIAGHATNNVVTLFLAELSGKGGSPETINENATWFGVIFQITMQVVFALLVVRSYRRRFART